MKNNNSLFAEQLCKLCGGQKDDHAYRSCTWINGNKKYLVRCAKTAITTRIPTTLPVDGIVFYLSDYKCWGIADFSKKTLGPSDANMGFLNLNIA